MSGKVDACTVEDFAQKAVVKVLSALASFRGEGKFLTWALAIGMRVALTELRKARWKDVSFDALSDDGRAMMEPGVQDADFAQAEEKHALLSTLRRLIETTLTERQRTVITAELVGEPQVVIAERLGINRNALYKLSHDARMKLKAGLLDAGISAEDVRSAFSDAS